MVRKRILFIINPVSGTMGKLNWITLATRLLAKNFDLEFKQTQGRGHACKLAQDAVRDRVDIVCAVGGDGTVNEIASALIETDTVLAILPLGSGNGLARELRISTLLPNLALEVMRSGNVVDIDYGVLNNIPFFGTCGFGFDAKISYEFAKRKHRGVINYIKVVIKEYYRYVPKEVQLTINGQTITRKVFLINFANSRQFGNNAYIAPLASLTDGLINVTIVKPLRFREALRLSLALFDKRIHKLNSIETFTCEKAQLLMPKGAICHYDGEPIKLGEEAHIEIVKGGLKVLVPK